MLISLCFYFDLPLSQESYGADDECSPTSNGFSIRRVGENERYHLNCLSETHLHVDRRQVSLSVER